jgi:hypothetical protein
MRHYLHVCILMATTPALFAQAPVTQLSANTDQVILEYTGQVINTPPAASIQYGFFNVVRGFDSAFRGGPENESNANFTFYTEATTTRTVVNGPLRIITREGTTTAYLASAAGDFNNPDSFRAGVPIQVSTMHQQVVTDITAQTFSVVNVNTITAANPFVLAGGSYRLGAPGEAFRTSLAGHLTASGPPTGHFGGYATGITTAGMKLTADPNPIVVRDGSGKGQTTLFWYAPGITSTEIRVNSVDGPILARGGASGTAQTGKWVTNGMTFYLQDASGGRAQSADSTVAKVSVAVE